MKILFVSALLPYPLYSGGQVRIYNLLKLLSKKHSITLLSFIRNEKERKYAGKLAFLSGVHTVYRGRALQLKYLFGALGKYPWLLSTYANPEMRNLIQKELSTGTYDLVHIEPFYVYPSLPDISVPLVVGEHNIEYMVYGTYAGISGMPLLRPLMLSDVGKLRVWEELVWKKATTVVTVSPSDARVVSKYSKRPVTVVPNGVDIKSIRYVPHTFDPAKKTFLFVGNFSWTPNIEAVRTLLAYLWPVICKKYPGALLTVVGRNFPASLRSFVTKGVSVRDNIPDIRDAFAGNDILLAPMGIPGGTKFKLLEAMASGLAVITTKDGSMGLDVTAGIHFWEAESIEDTVRAIGDIYSNPDETRQRTRQARELVEQKYDWNIIAQKLDDVWKISL